jgi:hypothetical protein
VISIVRVGIEGSVDEVMNAFPIGSKVKVKCRLGYTSDDHTLSLMCDKMDLISTVKVMIV